MPAMAGFAAGPKTWFSEDDSMINDKIFPECARQLRKERPTSFIFPNRFSNQGWKEQKAPSRPSKTLLQDTDAAIFP